jgi:hypothetical protein
MKNSKTSLALALVTLVSAAGSFAQTTATPTRPEGTPAGSSATGTTNSGGVAPATGRPETTPTGPTAGGTGSGTTAPTPTPPAVAPDRPGNSGNAGNPGNSGNMGRPESPGRSAPHTVNENASDNAKAVQAVLRQFDAKRDAMAAERKALIEKLNAATTETERKAILEQLRTEKQAQADEQRALGKEIREELRKVRDQRKTGGG